jgi:hypothetical protein
MVVDPLLCLRDLKRITRSSKRFAPAADPNTARSDNPRFRCRDPGHARFGSYLSQLEPSSRDGGLMMRRGAIPQDDCWNGRLGHYQGVPHATAIGLERLRTKTRERDTSRSGRRDTRSAKSHDWGRRRCGDAGSARH